MEMKFCSSTLTKIPIKKVEDRRVLKVLNNRYISEVNFKTKNRILCNLDLV